MWDDPELYDLENADDPAFDLDYWTALLRERAPRRVLELACGTGRLTLPLASLGVAEEIVALDRSAPFLSRLRSRLDEERVDSVRVVEGDMRSPAVDGEFDLVMVSFNSLAYLISREDRVACLRAARALLAAGGVFAFDLIAPRYDFLSEATGPCPVVRADTDHASPEHGVSRFLRSYTDTYDAVDPDAALDQPLRDLPRGRPGRAPHRRPRLAHLLPGGARAAARGRRPAGRRALRGLRARALEAGLQTLSLARRAALG